MTHNGQTVTQAMRQYFPNVSTEEQNGILLEETAFPFERETVIIEQLRKCARAIELKRHICKHCGKMRFKSQMNDWGECIRCAVLDGRRTCKNAREL